MKRIITFTDIVSSFQSGQIHKEELEDMIKELVKNDTPDRTIDSIDYTKDGIVVTLDDEQIIEIEIDWNEILIEDNDV